MAVLTNLLKARPTGRTQKTSLTIHGKSREATHVSDICGEQLYCTFMWQAVEENGGGKGNGGEPCRIGSSVVVGEERVGERHRKLLGAMEDWASHLFCGREQENEKKKKERKAQKDKEKSPTGLDSSPGKETSLLSSPPTDASRNRRPRHSLPSPLHGIILCEETGRVCLFLAASWFKKRKEKEKPTKIKKKILPPPNFNTHGSAVHMTT